MHIIGEVYAQSTPYSPQSVADSVFAFKLVWFTIGGAFLTFFSLCYFRVRSTMLALRYSAWLLVASAFLYGMVSFTSFGVAQRSQADATLEPRNVQVIPLNSSRVSIKWSTDKPAIQYVIYSLPDGREQLIFDDKTPEASAIHSVTISSLQRRVHYPFRIRYNDQDFKRIDGQNLDIFIP